MTNDKLFEFLLTRLTTRETASLAFATIASSASLVLLAFGKDIADFWLIPVIGILFPAFGIAYIEITNHTIHKYDHELIRRIIKDDPETKLDSEKILVFTKRRWARLALTRILMFSPIAGWIIMMAEVFSPTNATSIIIIGFFVVAVCIIMIVATDKIKKID